MKTKNMLTIICFTVLSSLSLAKTIHVPADQPTIQMGILWAAQGDTVLVAPGEYFENIWFYKKVVIVKSSHGPEQTIINGSTPTHSEVGSVVSFVGIENVDVVLEGFTLMGGTGTVEYAPWGTRYGGGIYCDRSDPTIVNNIIKFNTAHYGAGIYIDSFSDPMISENLIERNSTCTLSPYSRGGGIYCGGGSTATITNNTIIWNATNPFNSKDADGGGICCHASLEISHNVIAFNSAGADGGGIALGNGSPVVTDNIITDNWAGRHGGGIECSSSSDTTIKNNMISRNVAA
ncbi:MAG: right-handed parallel beta-helix repeat-containing protein, partial [Planctomycetota bacterium]